MDPQDLYNLLQEHAQDLLDVDATAAELMARINGAEIVVRNSARITTVTLLDTLTQAQYTAVRTVLEAQAVTDPYVRGINEALAGTGLRFDDVRVQEFIESLRPALGDELTDFLLAIGVERTPTIDVAVTTEQVEEALAFAVVAARITNAVALVRERMAAHMSAADQVSIWGQAWLDAESQQP